MRKNSQKLIIIALLFILSQSLIQPVLAEGIIVLDFFYSSNCESCEEKLILIENDFEKNETYNGTLTVNIKDIAVNEEYLGEYLDKYIEHVVYPFVVIKSGNNETVIDEMDITVEYVGNVIASYLEGGKPNEISNDKIINTPFGKINISNLSLPILAIILGGLDSFNPCAFFILIFLLNLLLYARSRRKMLLIGGVFIFFSGFLYAIFMFLLFETFLLNRVHVALITVIAGILALSLGVINIKDFFFFKKGASLSIPDDKKPGIYKQMRNLVKNPQVSAAIIGTIVLAGTVNFYELLCTLGLPLVFTRNLALYDMSAIEYYTYIFFYNIVYVIPLIIIVLIFVLTLGKRKLTEWHGQVMKLETGIMLACFGILFLTNYKLLENVVTPILLLVFSFVATAVVSTVWKKYFVKKRVTILHKSKEKVGKNEKEIESKEKINNI